MHNYQNNYACEYRAMLDELRTFVLLAEEGSIQRVAERLPLTQPAVTRQIQRLESVLNLELLDRRQKPPRLTPAGVEVLSRSRDILAAYADLLALGKRTEPDGLLRIGVANGLADDRFAAVISDIRRRFPRVSLRLMTGWSQDLSEKLRRGFLDAAVLLAGEKGYAGSTTIGLERLAVVGPDRPADFGFDITDPDTLAWVLSPEPCEARQMLAAATSARPLKISAEVQDARMQFALVRQGMGLSVMPERLFEAERPEGIVMVKVPWLNLVLNIQLQRAPHLHRLEIVVDAIAEGLRGDRAPT